jgi:AcrR family transcriptional regulator
MASEPAFTRLPVDERRKQLLDLGARLFTRHSYDELSMASIAREAGISKPLLYHYFASKQDFFRATLAEAAEDLRARTEPDPSRAPVDQLDGALEAFLAWVDDNREAYLKLIESAASLPEVRELVDGVRTRTAARILAGVYGGAQPAPRARAAALGWLWFMDGAIQDWLAHGDFTRDELKRLLMGALAGTLSAAGAGDRAAVLAGASGDPGAHGRLEGAPPG